MEKKLATVYDIGSVKSASNYESITKYWISYIRKTFTDGKDIADALENRTEPNFKSWIPTMDPDYSATDAAKQGPVNDGYKLLYDAEIKEMAERKARYRSNKGNAHALLWENCSKQLKEKIQMRTDYQKIKLCPIALLAAIKEHSINFNEDKYGGKTVAEAIRNFGSIRQREDEGLNDYAIRFKSIGNILLEQIGGVIEFPKIMDNLQISKEEAFNHIMGLMFLETSNSQKYAPLSNHLENQYSLNKIEYPRAFNDMLKIMSNYKSTDKKSSENKKSKSIESKMEAQAPELSFAQNEEVLCYCCGKKNHKSPECFFRSSDRAQWFINKNKPAQEKKPGGKEKKKDNPQWMMAQANEDNNFMKTHLLLDSQSTIDLICNSSLVTDIHDIDTPIILNTNAGSMVVKKQATMPDYGLVYFSEEAMANVISLANMSKKYHVQYDSAKEDAIIVTHGECKAKFIRTKSGLYAKKIKMADVATCMVETVKENENFYTPRQISRAKRARELINALGYPSISDVKNILKMNSIRNCPVTLEDVILAENIYGKNIASLKGKTTRKKPEVVINDNVEIPQELKIAQRDIGLCVDVMYVQGMPFLTTVSKNVKYHTAVFLTSRKIEEIKEKLINVLNIYKSADFIVKTIFCDGEFKPLQQFFAGMNIKVNVTSANEHVPDIERSIRTIKERIRATVNELPFNKMTSLMWKYLVMETTRKLNLFPAKNGVSAYFSPREIMHSVPLDYEKQCKFPMFSYVEASDEPSPLNSMSARTISCLYIRPTSSSQSGHELLNLNTNQIITRRNIEVLPMPESIIQKIDGLSRSVIIRNDKDNNNLAGVDGEANRDSGHLAGVDSDADSNDSNDDECISEIMLCPRQPEPETHEDEEEIADNEMDENNNSIMDGSHEDDEENVNHNEINTEINDDDNNESEESFQSAMDDEEEKSEDPVICTRTRTIKPPDRLIAQMCQHGTNDKVLEYNGTEARALADVLQKIIEKDRIKVETCLATTYSLNKGIEMFEDRGRQAATEEMKQLYDRECFKPIKKKDLSKIEYKHALESLIFITEKRDGKIKARHCANGSTQRDYFTKEDVTSPTVSCEATLLTTIIEAEENRNVITCDIPNAFIQTDLEDSDERIIMKIRGQLVDILCNIDEGYQNFVTNENSHKIIYVHVQKAIYGLLVSAMLFYKKLARCLKEKGYKINPYDSCVANKVINGKQHTVTWHVDDLKASHVESKVNEEFIKWLKREFGKIGEIKVVKGNIHDYLGMVLDYSKKGQVSINMVKYVDSMIKDFPGDISGRKVASPWTEDLFKVDEESQQLEEERAKVFHTITAQGLFLCKRARPDIAPAIAFLTTRVQRPTEEDWQKLCRLMKYLYQTSGDILTLKSDKSRVLQWHVDAAFAVHPDYKSHTGGMLSMGGGALSAVSRKQKINTRSSTEAEIVAVDDMVTPMVWTKLFLEAQGYEVKNNTLNQDNQSAIKMAINGKQSAGKRSRHLNIRLFYITDQIAKKNIDVTFCPTDDMVADYFTKPLHGEKFKQFRQVIMNLPKAAQLMMWHCTQL